MTTSGQHIIDAALKLPATERAEVVQELVDSLSPQAEELIDDAWAAELDRRLGEMQRDEGKAVPWSQLQSEE